MTIDIRLKNDDARILIKDVVRTCDLTFDPKWFWAERKDGTKKYIATDVIRDITISDGSLIL